jgi:hypothetical protein
MDIKVRLKKEKRKKELTNIILESQHCSPQRASSTTNCSFQRFLFTNNTALGLTYLHIDSKESRGIGDLDI